MAKTPDEKRAEREAFIAAYEITTRSGEYMSREEVLKTVVARLRDHFVANPTQVAKRYLDDHAWLRFRKGNTAGAIARDVVDASAALWGTDTERRTEKWRQKIDKLIEDLRK